MEIKEFNPKSRFSNRVENYTKYRPNYPNEMIEFLSNKIGLTKNHIIADIGSGTGISSKLFLDNGNKVYGIELNLEMRKASEKYLKGYENFHPIDGDSEDTKLEVEAVDMIISGQAFHWFEPEPTKKEFLRILKPDGYGVIFNNRRKFSDDKFMNEYMDLVQKYSEEELSKPLNVDLPLFFGEKMISREVFSNPQVFNLERLIGDLVSYSYIPNEENIKFNDMISEFEFLFKKYSNNGKLIFDYETVLTYCKMK